jgi:DNA-binding MarR family transcriptional regulator
MTTGTPTDDPGTARTERHQPQPLSTEEEALWRAFTRVMLVAPRALEADLVRSSRLNFAEYHVLAYLSEQPGRSLRMSNLSDLSALSPSGMTRVVERLARQGLIDRRRSADDGRGQVAVLTDAGLARLEEAWPDHLLSVRRRVMDQLAGVDATALTAAFDHIVDACES